MAALVPNGRQQFIDIDGHPLVAGTVGMYVPNTLTPKNTWQDSGQTVLNTNPIVLDSRGQATIWGEGFYRQILKDAAGNLIWDKITNGSPSRGSGLIIYSSDYTTLLEADTAAAAVDGLLVIDEQWTLTANYSNLSPWWFEAGEIILGAYDLTLNFQFDGLVQQIFDTSGGGSVLTSGPGLTTRVYAEWFGDVAKGNDDTATINKALVVAASVSAPLMLLSKTYLCNSQITYDTSRTSLTSEGASIDFRGIAAGTIAILLTTSQTNSALQIPYNTIHALENIYLQGPSSNNGSPQYAVGFQAITISATKFIPGTKISGVSASGFYGMFNLSDGTFISTFENCSYANNGVSTGNMFVMTGSSNAGERYTIISPSILNTDGFLMDAVGNQNADFYVYGASIDGSSWIAVGGNSLSPSTTSARINFFGGHYEGLTNQYLVQVGTTGSVTLNGMFFVFQSTINHTLFYSEATLLHGGLQLVDCEFTDNALGGLPGEFMCDGPGRFYTRNCSELGNTSLRFSSEAGNRVPNFNFAASNDLTLNWAATGTATYDNTVFPPGGTGSGKMAGNGSFENTAIICAAGDLAETQMWIKTSGIVSASATITITLAYKTSGTQTLSSVASTITTDYAAFTLVQTIIGSIAPPGANIVYVAVSLSSSGGTPIVWFGRPCVSVH